MKKRVCLACGSVMSKKNPPEEVEYYCFDCNGFTDYQEKELDPYCPDCGEKIAVLASCCSLGYFCDKCGSAKSSKRFGWKRP